MKKNETRKDSFQSMDLTPDEANSMRVQFSIIDRARSGFISLLDLPTLFEAVGEFPNRDKMTQVETWVDEKCVQKRIDLPLAMRAWTYLKELNLKEDDDDFDVDILNTFVAMGGNSDKSGTVKKQKLVDIIKTQFGLTIDIEQMFEEAGIDTDKDLDFADFTCLLEAGGSQRASRICSIFSQASYA
jgi:calmodulin